MVTPEQVAKLLNRTLTTDETNNFKLYLNIAIERLEDLLCMNTSAGAGERTYQTRYNYKTVFVDPFTEINSITVDGDELDSDSYEVMLNDSYNAEWYNTIRFTRAQSGKKIVVDADWGFNSCPTALQQLLAQLFHQGSVERNTDNQVKSKKIDDFTVTYKDNATYKEFVTANQAVINKYGVCNQGYIRHGDVRRYYEN